MSYRFNGKIVAVGADPGLPSGLPLPKAPTNPADAQKWAEQQFKDYLQKEGIPISKDGALKFAQNYAAANGWPTTEAQAQKFLSDWAWTQAEAAGVPPEIIAARDLIEKPPTNADEAAAWMAELGKRYAARYGIPLSKDQLLQAAVYTATRSWGVDPAFAEVTVKALADGELTVDEAKQIAVAACAWAGAALGQAFGIPAPIGAFIGSALGGVVVDLVFSALGLGDSAADRARKLEAARARWRSTQTDWNTATLRNAWNAYLHYFESIEDTLQKLFEQYKDALAKSGGIRYYGSTEIAAAAPKAGAGLLGGLMGGVSASVAQAVSEATQATKPIARSCHNVGGCLYFTDNGKPYFDSVTVRMNPWEHEVPIQAAWAPCQPGAKLNGVLSPYAALKFWGAAPRPSPTGHVGMSDWDQVWQLSTELRGKEGQAAQASLALAAKMREEVDAGAAAMAFIIRDVIRTMAWVVVEEEIKKESTAEFARKLHEAEQRGAERSDVLNSVLLAAGAGALAGWATAKLR